mmetsp:Transcript_94714/g.149842  ORF Transcript_94714/g.149842 Transcript_94714/m.149842 type:complete len:908 (+) Transcript_94714:64-2787(+)
MRNCFLGGALLLASLVFPYSVQAQIMSVDLGHEFFKVALMKQGAPLEVILNSVGGRKTPTAASFYEATRSFGNEAVQHFSKAPSKVPVFFHHMLGNNYTAEDVTSDGQWWKDFGLSPAFYPYVIDYLEERGVPVFSLGDKSLSSEQVLGNILYYAQKMAMTVTDGKPVRDCVITVPSGSNLRFRQAVVSAAEIAGLNVLSLVHEGAAFAVQRAVDFTVEKGNVEHALFYNLGSRKAEVTIVKFESRQAGMVAGKTAPVVTIMGTALDYGIGGHFMDLKITEAMLKKFQEKYPKMADGIAKNPRAMRKLITQAVKTKATLSANKAAPFIVESLYEDTDFSANIKREEFEEMCKDMFDRLTTPIETALEKAGVKMEDIQHVELIGGAWRVPKVQTILSDYIEKAKGSKVPLGQHLNGEESGAMGAALVGANYSTSFKVKKFWFTDLTSHSYAVHVTSLTGTWEKNKTVLYPVGEPLGAKKKLSFQLEEDFQVKLFEDDVLISEYVITGLANQLEGKWKDYNTTGMPKVSVNVNLEISGIIELKNPTATIEELYWVNVTKEKPKANTTNYSANGTDANATDENATESEGTDENATNATNATKNESKVEYEVVLKQKKKKHETKLVVKRIDYKPIPMTQQEVKDSAKLLEEMAKAEADALLVNQLKNDLESIIYSGREKCEMEDFQKCSTSDERDQITALATEYEEWMYEGSIAKDEYESRLKKLRDLIGPVEERLSEMEARVDLPGNVKDGVDAMKKQAATLGKNKTFVNETKLEAAMTKVTEFEEWWSKKQESQKKLALHETPAYTKTEVMEKLNKLSKEWDRQIKAATKEPKKPKEEKKKANASDTAKAGGSKAKEQELPADKAGVEAELKALREKKIEAVEKEDFDTAASLKDREKKLEEHLKKLEL